MGLEVWGLGSGVWGFQVWDLGFWPVVGGWGSIGPYDCDLFQEVVPV